MTETKNDITPTPKVENLFQCKESAVEAALKKLSDKDFKKIKDFVDNLVRLGVKAVVFDFDQTIITTHTTGVAREDTIPYLSTTVTPTFIVMACLLNDANILITVGTFSDILVSQAFNANAAKAAKIAKADGKEEIKLVPFVSGPELISRVLAPYMNLPETDIVGYYPKEHPDRTEKYKQYHLTKLSKHLGLSPIEMALIDDDKDNVYDAADKGYLSYWVPAKKGIDMSTFTAIFEPEPIDL